MKLLKKVVHTNWFSTLVDVVILLYATLLVVEYARFTVSTYFDTLQMVFLWCFLVEILLVMYVYYNVLVFICDPIVHTMCTRRTASPSLVDHPLFKFCFVMLHCAHCKSTIGTAWNRQCLLS